MSEGDFRRSTLMPAASRFEAPNRRAVLRGAASFAAMGAAFGLASGLPLKALAQQGSNQGPATRSLPANVPALKGTRIVLLGTLGGPGVDMRRAETGSVVLVDGTPYLIDCGYGTVRDLVACGLGYTKISTAFFSHLHNDHTLDLPALLSLQWTSNKTSATNIYGPYGTEAMVKGALEFFEGDVGIRVADEGRTIDPKTHFLGHDLKATSKPAEVFKDDKVMVSSIENAHFPDRSKAHMPYRSLAYRFDTKTRSIVFSGDTAYTDNLVALAKGADVLVSEIMSDAIYDQMEKLNKAAAARGNPNNIWRHVAETHSRPEDVGRTARLAGVKTVVLNHLLPGGTKEGKLNFPVSTFIDGVRKEFDGEVIVGNDLMVI